MLLLLLSRFSHGWLCTTPWTVAHQAPPSMGFSRQEYWSGVPLPSLHQTHRHLKTHYWTLHCTPKRRDPALPTRTLMQASLTRKLWQATCPTQPTGKNLHNKEEPQTSSIQKGHPKHSNLNKMKRQRNVKHVKERDKSPLNQTKEEEIGSETEKEFRIMIVKMIQTFENKMELQINNWRQINPGDKDWENVRKV